MSTTPAKNPLDEARVKKARLEAELDILNAQISAGEIPAEGSKEAAIYAEADRISAVVRSQYIASRLHRG